MKVIKRNGESADYDIEKISIAVEGAFEELGEIFESAVTLNEIDFAIKTTYPEEVSVEQIQDIVEEKLCENGYIDEARAYIKYRYRKELIRQSNTTDKAIKELLEGDSEFWNTENSNKNSKWVTTQRDYIAGITSKDIARRFIFPKDIMENHDKGRIHIHDLDYAAQNTLTNCCLINLEDMLQNGTVINGVTIDRPHSFRTAATIATQIIAAVASSQYGGTSISVAALAPFIRDSWNRYYDEAFDEFNNLIEDERVCDEAKKVADKRLKKEIRDGVQTINYQLNSLSTTNGQAPFITLFLYMNETDEYKEELALLIEEILNQRIQGMKNKVGVYVSPAFPKLIYTLEEDNMSEDAPYWYLTKLAAECSAKRLVPDYISEKVMKELKINANGDGDCYTCMGCRSFLTPDRSGNGFNNIARAKNYDGKPKYYGRYNVGVSTVNLAYIGLEAYNDFSESLEDTFFEKLDEACELCHKAQQIRLKRLENTKAEVAPILWCDGAFARLEPQEYIKPLLYGGYATSSLGYAGLYECVKTITGESHTHPKGREFGLKVMQFLNDKCAEWKAAEDVDYSLYGTPIESTTYKFAKAIKVFPTLEGVNDRDYVTNSYHIPVFEEIDAFEKLEKESEFQVLSPGGAISYVETANLQGNIPAVLELIKFIYNHIMYAELNTKSDYCQKCGYDGEILIKLDEETDKHYFECPNCGNVDQDTMNIARRVCGYISTNGFNEGRLEEIAERVVHLDDKEA